MEKLKSALEDVQQSMVGEELQQKQSYYNRY
jgi:hypothetical protein